MDCVGLALRNLCSLRFSGSFEYLVPLINDALKDIDGYVRKTAIMGCVKVHYLQHDALQAETVDYLYKMIKDNDPLVIVNAIQALNEILPEGMAVSSKMIVYLLNRLKEFNEFGQTVIIEQLSKFEPKTDKEMFDIMNLLEDRLKHSSVSIVLATIKVFLNFTKSKPKLYSQVVDRVKAPLITLASSSEIFCNFEITYIVLSHIFYITTKGFNESFEKDYKIFYCRVDEPSYNKILKLDILAMVASENNIGDMLNELGEYVTDVDAEISRKSIQALGIIAIRLPELASAIVKQLCSFVSLQKEYITNEVFVGFKDILRKQAKHVEEIIEVLSTSMDSITDSGSKAALIYILGEYGDRIPLAPYLLENFVEDKMEALEVKHALLVACVKLFFTRGPEMQAVLGKLFAQVINDASEDIDLKDRAAFYYRALQSGMSGVQKAAEVDKFLEEQELNKEHMQIEFNTLAAIYKKQASKFIKSKDFFSALRNKEQEEEHLAQKQHDAAAEHPPQSQPQSTPAVPQQTQDNLIDLVGDDNLQQQQQSGGAPDLLEVQFENQGASLAVEDFKLNFEIDEDQFESSWSELNER